MPRLNLHQIESALQEEYLLYPDRSTDTHTLPAEGIPAQSLRSCLNCGGTLWLDPVAAPRYQPRKMRQENA